MVTYHAVTTQQRVQVPQQITSYWDEEDIKYHPFLSGKLLTVGFQDAVFPIEETREGG
jgi:hypothetical protein